MIIKDKTLKIYINREPKYGPWGGGSKTVNKLVERCKELGFEVAFRLSDDIDVIFCIDPRPNNYGEWYQHFLDHKSKHGTKIIQRVGDIGTHGKPELTKLVRQTLNYSDYFIFPSYWARDTIGFIGDNSKVIFNKPMKEFYNNRKPSSDLSDPPKLVTHHWSTNPKKGFDIYQKLENFCLQTGKYKFTYIGRKPNNYKFANSFQPMDVEALCNELPSHDIYITASIEEAGANHVLEALACSLPVVYHNLGGSIGDYCKEYGEGYNTFDEMLVTIDIVANKYSLYKDKVDKYESTNDHTIEQYVQIIKEVIEGV